MFMYTYLRKLTRDFISVHSIKIILYSVRSFSKKCSFFHLHYHLYYCFRNAFANRVLNSFSYRHYSTGRVQRIIILCGSGLNEPILVFCDFPRKASFENIVRLKIFADVFVSNRIDLCFSNSFRTIIVYDGYVYACVWTVFRVLYGRNSETRSVDVREVGPPTLA